MKKILYCILGSGILLRCLIFFQNRSLFIDEANLARNIVERDYGGLFQNLDYEQYAPPFFSSILKTFTLLFGTTEYALRAFPLLCGIITLFVFYQLVQRFCSDMRMQVYPLALLAFSWVFVQYSTEVKQYSSDVLTALVLLYFATDECFSFFKNPDKKIPICLFWSLLGAFTIWFSMPSVFFLAAIGSLFFIQALRKPSTTLGFIVLTGLVWLASFGVYYYLILSGDIGDDNLKGYHANYFFPLLPISWEELSLQGQLIRQLFGSTFGSTALAIGWGMISVFIGGIQLFQKNKRALWLLVVPIALVLVASNLEYYSLIKRLTLFFLPNMMLLSLVGTAWCFRRSNTYLKTLIVLILAIVLINQKSYQYVNKPFAEEELRPLLYQVKTDWVEPEVLFVSDGGLPAFAYYVQHAEQKEVFQFLKNTNTLYGNWERKERDFVNGLNVHRPQTWAVLYAHTSEAEKKRLRLAFSKHGKLMVQKEVEGAFYWGYERWD